MEDLIRVISMALVDVPADVRVNRIKSTDGLSIYEIKVAKADTGKVICKHGRNAAGIRTIVNAVSSKMNKHAMVEIIE